MQQKKKKKENGEKFHKSCNDLKISDRNFW